MDHVKIQYTEFSERSNIQSNGISYYTKSAA
jgi:hypothetical protein